MGICITRKYSKYFIVEAELNRQSALKKDRGNKQFGGHPNNIPQSVASDVSFHAYFQRRIDQHDDLPCVSQHEAGAKSRRK